MYIVLFLPTHDLIPVNLKDLYVSKSSIEVVKNRFEIRGTDVLLPITCADILLVVGSSPSTHCRSEILWCYINKNDDAHFRVRTTPLVITAPTACISTTSISPRSSIQARGYSSVGLLSIFHYTHSVIAYVF